MTNLRAFTNKDGKETIINLDNVTYVEINTKDARLTFHFSEDHKKIISFSSQIDTQDAFDNVYSKAAEPVGFIR